MWGWLRSGELAVGMALVFVGVVFLPSLVAAAAGPRVTARSALIMDAQTGEVLWSKKPDQRRAPASTTKVVTTMLALESGRLDESFKVSRRAQRQVPSKLNLRTGQRITLRDLTYSLMLKSANDGAVVVAEGLGGSVEKFAKSMDKRAAKTGATRTTFKNPSGLSHSKHLSTARDLAKIMRAALEVPGFRKVAGTQTRRIRIRGKTMKNVSLRSKNRLLKGYFASVIGKTGYTRAAGRCFVGAATYNGRESIVVILGAKDLWGDTRKLIEWAHRGNGRDAWPQVQMARAKPAPRIAAAKPAPRIAAAKPAPRVAAAKPAPRVAAAKPASRVATGSRPPTESLSASRTRAGALPTGGGLVRPSSRVASVQREDEIPAYVRFYRPQGNIRRGCTGSGCSPSARSWPSR